MQLRLVFGGEALLPLHYRSTLSGVIYHLLDSNPEYAKALHEKQGFKGFIFGPVQGSYTLENDHFLFAPGASWEIRSIDPDFMENLLKRLLRQPELCFGKTVIPLRTWSGSHVTISKGEMDIVTRSPIVDYRTLEDGHTEFFSPKNENYTDHLIANAEKKWKVFGDGSAFSLSICPLPNRKPQKIFDIFHKTYITAYHGSYHLSGSPAVLNMLYQLGLGSKNSEGFGMFDLIEGSGRAQ